LEDIEEKQEMATVLFCDNKFTIIMLKNSVFHSQTKHINFKHYYIRKAVEDEEIEIKHVKIEDQLMDIFTKALTCDKFIYFRELLGMINKNIKGSVEINIFMFVFSLELYLSCLLL
jgi:hypothetical protein